MRSSVLRGLVLVAVVLSVSAAEEAAEPTEPEPVPAEGAAAEEAVPEEPEIVLNCNANELLDKVETWSVDCVAQWLENLGFRDLKTPFMGNKVDGAALAKDLSMAKLEEDYGVSDEDQRKKIYGSLKDVIKKDSYTGNTNYYSQMLMWLLPFGAIYLWLSLKYEKQIARYMKRYRKWQDQRNPKPPPEPKVDADGTSEWISGINADLNAPKGKKEKKLPKEKAPKEKAEKVA